MRAKLSFGGLGSHHGKTICSINAVIKRLDSDYCDIIIQYE